MTARTLQIVQYPEPVLRARARPIETITDEVRTVAARMVELMYEAGGVGLAAPQVGLGWRLFVANPTHEPGAEQIFINPALREPSRETEAREEGCLSIPGVRAEITRPVAITIDALDEEGNPFQLHGHGIPARVWQHEYDHLEGTLIIDRMTPIDRMANKRAIKELEG